MKRSQIEPWQITLYAVFATQLLTMVGFSFVFPFLPLFVRELGIENPGEAAFWAGALGAAQGVSMFLVAPVWGLLADRWGRKPMLLRALFGASVTMAAMGLVTNVYQLLVLRFIQGLLTGTMGAAMALVAGETPRPKLAYAIGVLQMSVFVGNTFGPLGGGILSEALGFRATFLVTATMLFLSGVAVLVLVRERFEPLKSAPTASLRFWENFRLPGPPGQVLPILVVIFFVYAGPSLIMPSLPLYVQKLTGNGQAALMAGVALAVMGLTSALGSPLAGSLSERFDLRLVLIVCCFGAGLLYLPGGWATSIGFLVLVLAIVGFFKGGLVTASNTLLGMMIPQERHGAAYGVAQSIHAAAFGLGPLLGGILASTLGLGQVFVATGVLFLALALYVTRALPRTQTARA